MNVVIILVVAGWIVAMAIAAATSGPKRYVTAETPGEAARLWVGLTNETYAGSYTPLLTKEYFESAVVLYELPASPLDMLYYQHVKGRDAEWYIDTVAGGSGHSLFSTEELGSYIVFAHDYSYGGYPAPASVIYGRSVSDEVAAVEVTYSSGIVMRAPIENGLFLLVSGLDVNFDVISAVDADGDVLAEWVNP